jgi:hypothetical protein
MKNVGLDIGTMNICSAIGLEENKIELNSSRNMFVEVDTDLITISEIENTDLDYIQLVDDEKVERVFIISEDCLRFSQIFGQSPHRPMSSGIISSSELDAALVMGSIVEGLVARTREGNCVFSVPAAPIDKTEVNVLYHEKIFSKIMTSLGYNAKPLNEAMAVVFSNCSSTRFSGIGISWGCGMTNVAVSYRGMPAFTFSISRGGDYVDECVSRSLGIPISRVTGIKERKLDLLNPTIDTKNRREKQVLEALTFYYQELIDYVLKIFLKEFNRKAADLEVDEQLPIILSGGTSLPNGFIELFNKRFESFKNFPYDISEVRRAKNPLFDVAEGCLMYALWDQKKNQGEKKNDKPGKK